MSESRFTARWQVPPNAEQALKEHQQLHRDVKYSAKDYGDLIAAYPPAALVSLEFPVGPRSA